MPVFTINNQSLIPVKEVAFDREKNLQALTEDNLEAVFGLSLIAHEIQLNGLRIDTLGFNQETKSFVIIEYKKDRSFSIIDQGYAYLSLVLNNKADFILEYNEGQKNNLKREDVDWSQTRVVFIANSFTIHQKNAINFKDLPIELWEVKKYSNDTLLYNQLQTPDSSESIKTVSRSATVEKVSREVKNYTVDDHFNDGWESSKELFESIRQKILDIDPRVVEKVNKFYIGYKIGFYNICALHIQKSKLRLDLVRVDKKDLKDPENRVVQVNWQKLEWGKQASYSIESASDIEYGIYLIKQVYEKYYKSL